MLYTINKGELKEKFDCLLLCKDVVQSPIILSISEIKKTLWPHMRFYFQSQKELLHYYAVYKFGNTGWDSYEGPEIALRAHQMLLDGCNVNDSEELRKYFTPTQLKIREFNNALIRGCGVLQLPNEKHPLMISKYMYLLEYDKGKIVVKEVPLMC